MVPLTTCMGLDGDPNGGPTFSVDVDPIAAEELSWELLLALNGIRATDTWTPASFEFDPETPPEVFIDQKSYKEGPENRRTYVD